MPTSLRFVHYNSCSCSGRQEQREQNLVRRITAASASTVQIASAEIRRLIDISRLRVGTVLAGALRARHAARRRPSAGRGQLCDVGLCLRTAELEKGLGLLYDDT